MISTYIIIIISVLFVLSLVAPLFSPFFRAMRMKSSALGETPAEPAGDEPEGEETPSPKASEATPVSVVIVGHDCAYRLEQILPDFLSQKYDGDYQVVVVIDQGDSDSEDVLKRHKDNPHLYYTLLPMTSRYISRKKLGITLGIRAAKHDWVIVTDVHCKPSSDEWLSNMAAYCTEDRNMVLGLTPFDEETSSYTRFEHLRTMLYYFRSAQKGMPFSTNQSVVALRKSEFFDAKGFGGNLEFTRAEFEFLVNKFARKNSCAIVLEPEAWLSQFVPQTKRWRGRRLFAMDAMKGMERTFAYSFLSGLDMCLMHSVNVLCLLAVIAGTLVVALPDVFTDYIPYLDALVLLCSAAGLWIVSLVERVCIYRSVMQHYTEMSPLLAVMLEWTVTLRNIILRVRYWFADKNDFITHKL